MSLRSAVYSLPLFLVGSWLVMISGMLFIEVGELFIAKSQYPAGFLTACLGLKLVQKGGETQCTA
jgi:hypothetical protein